MKSGTIRAQATISKKSIIAGAVSMLLVSAPLLVQAAQIAPNPNPAGSTITILSDFSAVNNATPFNNYGLIDINQSRFTNAGTLNNFGIVVLYHANPLDNSVGATLNNYGVIAYDGLRESLTNAGTLNNFGSWRPNSVGNLTNSVEGTLNNYGSIGTSSEPIFVSLTNDGTLNNDVGATIATISTSNTGILRNAGTVNSLSGMTNTGTVINTGVIAGPPPNYDPSPSDSYIQTAGHTINNGILSQSISVDIQGGSLRGTGVITTPVLALASGTLLSPGTASTFGTLTLNGNLQSSGNMLFHIGGLGAGQFDVLAIHGMAFLNGGTIGVNFVNFSPVAGSSWDFLSATAITGLNTLSFAVSGLSSNLTYAFNYSNGVETLRVYSVPEPSSFLLLAFALGGLALWRWLKRI